MPRRARHYHHRRDEYTARENPAPSGHRDGILKMTPDSFVHALEHLDPGSRALLDLSLHRGLDDGEIAELLGADADYVSSSRDAAIERLAADLGMHGDAERVREALAEMPEDAWRRQGAASDEQPAEDAAIGELGGSEHNGSERNGSEYNGSAAVADLPHVTVAP